MVIEQVNQEEEKVEGHKRKTNTSMVKDSGLRQKREMKRNPRLAWLMLENVYIMYHNINKK